MKTIMNMTDSEF